MWKNGRLGMKQKELNELEVREKVERLTYPQDWASYNAAKTKEKILCEELVLELIESIVPYEKRNIGRKGYSIKERLYSMFLYAYNGHSSRRSISDVEIARRRKIIDSLPHFNSVLNFFNDQEMSSMIARLIEITAMPLVPVELDFAVDSTGFSTPRFENWFNIRLQKEVKKRDWKKLHAICGTKTNIITSLTITDGTEADSPELEPLVNRTSLFFKMREVSADKAYSSRHNLSVIAEAGAIPLIPFKSNATIRSKGYRLWKTMFMFYTQNQEKFMEMYHKRSNVESLYSMIKRNLGNNLRTKSDISQTNEILMKCFIHNLTVLVQESFELGIEIDFDFCAKTHYAQNHN